MSTFVFTTDAPTSLNLTETQPAAAGGGAATAGAASSPRLTGSLKLSVRNTDMKFSRVGRLSVQPTAPAPTGWFTFRGAPSTTPGQSEIELDKEATQTVEVLVAIPREAPPEKYVFAVRIASEQDPDNDVAFSPAIAFTVPAAKDVVIIPPPFPWWIVAVAAAVVIAVGLGGYFAIGPISATFPVPDERNVDVAKATVDLTKLGLQVQANLAQSPQAAGSVISTQPANPTPVKKGDTVILNIAFPQQAAPGHPCGGSQSAMIFYCQHPMLSSMEPARLNQLTATLRAGAAHPFVLPQPR